MTGIAQLSNITAAATADGVVLAWETHDVATACDLPVVDPAPCPNMVRADAAGHRLHQFPCREELQHRTPRAGPRSSLAGRSRSRPCPAGNWPPPIHAAVSCSFPPLRLNHRDPFGATVAYTESEGYSLDLTEKYAR